MNCLETNVCAAGCEHDASFPSQPDVSDDSYDFNVNKVHATCFFFVLYKRKKKNTKKETSPGESPRLHWFVECNFDIKELHQHKGKGHVRVKQTAGRGMKKKKRETIIHSLAKQPQ